MSWIFNPFTRTFDRVGGGTTQAPNYQETFDATTDWGSASSGFYNITILASTHGKGLNPIVQVYENNAGDFQLLSTSVSIDSITGDITLGVVEAPDGRFAGKIVISENN